MPDDHHPPIPRRNPEDVDLGAIKADLEFLIEGFTGMKEREAKIPQAAKVELTNAAERIVELYDSWGLPEKAADWRTKLPKSAEAKSKP